MQHPGYPRISKLSLKLNYNKSPRIFTILKIRPERTNICSNWPKMEHVNCSFRSESNNLYVSSLVSEYPNLQEKRVLHSLRYSAHYFPTIPESIFF